MRRLVPIALAAAALAGCGSDVGASNAYVRAVDAARATFDRDVASVTRGLRETSTPARTRSALGDLGVAADAFVGRLEAVRPPEAVAGLHGELVGAAAAYRREFAEARERFGTEDPAVYLQARTELQRDAASAAARLNGLIDRINARLRA